MREYRFDSREGNQRRTRRSPNQDTDELLRELKMEIEQLRRDLKELQASRKLSKAPSKHGDHVVQLNVQTEQATLLADPQVNVLTLPEDVEVIVDPTVHLNAIASIVDVQVVPERNQMVIEYAAGDSDLKETTIELKREAKSERQATEK